MDPRHEWLQALTRRHFLQTCQVGVGAAALTSLMNDGSRTAELQRRLPKCFRHG